MKAASAEFARIMERVEAELAEYLIAKKAYDRFMSEKQAQYDAKARQQEPAP
jgi:hypothetical protein